MPLPFFPYPSRTRAPSLRRHYPASSVLRAHPPPCRPGLPSRGSGWSVRSTGRASRVAAIPLFHACRRHYPGVTGQCSRRSLPGRWQPSPLVWWVGFRIGDFEACSAFTRVAACMVTEPPQGRPVASECFRPCRYLDNPLRLLPAGATVAGRVSHPLGDGAFSRRTHQCHRGSPARVRNPDQRSVRQFLSRFVLHRRRSNRGGRRRRRVRLHLHRLTASGLPAGLRPGEGSGAGPRAVWTGRRESGPETGARAAPPPHNRLPPMPDPGAHVRLQRQ